MIYNPTLTRVIYPSVGLVFSEAILWDIQSNQEVLAISTELGVSPEPKWSPEGNKFAIVRYGPLDKSELMIVDLEGSVEQQTQFASYTVSSIGHLSWSPDGRYIAFWLLATPSQYSDDRLIILDTITRRLTNYCIPGSFQGDSSPPIWSPDGRQLVVENYLGDNGRRVILVDIVQGFAAQIGEDISPVGWMVSP